MVERHLVRGAGGALAAEHAESPLARVDVSAQSGAEAGRHLQLALKFLEEGEALIEKDPVQASEKLYKAAEEAVKALAAALELPEAREAAERGRWSSQLLFDAADSAAAKLGAAELPLWWRAAWVLHVEGFHEARLSGERVKKDSRYVEALVDLARKTLARGL